MRKEIARSVIVWAGAVLCMAVGARAQGTSPAKVPTAKVPTAKPAAPVVSEAERSRRLAEGLAATSKLLAGRGDQIRELSRASTSAWTGPYLVRMEKCVPILDQMIAAANEGRSADLARSAVEGHLVVDGVYSEVHAKTRELGTQYLELIAKGATEDRAKTDALAREFDVGTKIKTFMASAVDLFDFPLQVVVEFAPSPVQASTFEAIAEGLPQVKASRARLEEMLRTAHELQRDPAAKKAAASRLAALGVGPAPVAAASTAKPGSR
jgi:hypothetical protein